jgi:sulfatase modifying factor 1
MHRMNRLVIVTCALLAAGTTAVAQSPQLPSGVELKDIPSGTFTMGGSTVQGDAPVVSVTLSAFRISATEITNAQYISFLNAAYADGWLTVEQRPARGPGYPAGTMENMVIGAGPAPNAGQVYLQLGETGGYTSGGEAEHIDNKSWISFDATSSTFSLLDSAKADWPVNWVKWYGADAFATYYNVSLPTEAQWEYAARGGQQLAYPTDDGSLDASKANYNGNTPGVYNPDGHVMAVGSYAANPFGLYDMGGNVWEWVEDYYDDSFYTDGATDPVNTVAGPDSLRVRRGGSWNYHASTLLSYARASDFQDRGNNHFGFRIAAPIPEPATAALLSIGSLLALRRQHRRRG